MLAAASLQHRALGLPKRIPSPETRVKTFRAASSQPSGRRRRCPRTVQFSGGFSGRTLIPELLFEIGRPAVDRGALVVRFEQPASQSRTLNQQGRAPDQQDRRHCDNPAPGLLA
jgi:hypothetical protein